MAASLYASNSFAFEKPATTTFWSSANLSFPVCFHPSYAIPTLISAISCVSRCRFTYTPSVSSNKTGVQISPWTAPALCALTRFASSSQTFSPSTWITFHTPIALMRWPVISVTFAAVSRYDISVMPATSWSARFWDINPTPGICNCSSSKYTNSFKPSSLVVS